MNNYAEAIRLLIVILDTWKSGEQISEIELLGVDECIRRYFAESHSDIPERMHFTPSERKSANLLHSFRPSDRRRFIDNCRTLPDRHVARAFACFIIDCHQRGELGDEIDADVALLIERVVKWLTIHFGKQYVDEVAQLLGSLEPNWATAIAKDAFTNYAKSDE
jgi:hypothetical protein